MCGDRELPKSTFYYEPIEKEGEKNEFKTAIQTIFSKSRNNYGLLKIKMSLINQDIPLEMVDWSYYE